MECEILNFSYFLPCIFKFFNVFFCYFFYGRFWFCSTFQGSSLPCDLNSLIDLRVIHFQFSFFLVLRMGVTISMLFTCWSRHQESLAFFVIQVGWLSFIQTCPYFVFLFEGYFARYSILLWKFLFSLRISFHLSLVSIISSEKSVTILLSCT